MQERDVGVQQRAALHELVQSLDWFGPFYPAQGALDAIGVPGPDLPKRGILDAWFVCRRGFEPLQAIADAVSGSLTAAPRT